MANVESTREAMLGRIRRILGEDRPGSWIESEWEALPRGYRVALELDEAAKIELLVDRLRDYDAEVYRIREEKIPETVRGILERLGIYQVLVPSGLNAEWLPKNASSAVPTLAAENAAKVGHGALIGQEPTSENPDVGHTMLFVEDAGFTPGELDRFAAVLTASTLAIAETGTIVLQNLPGQGRRAATLVPDVHLCVVRESDVVHTVPEAMRRLHATAELPTTFVSGPSATADIEMTRIKGVHGPRFLHVLLVV